MNGPLSTDLLERFARICAELCLAFEEEGAVLELDYQIIWSNLCMVRGELERRKVRPSA